MEDVSRHDRPCLKGTRKTAARTEKRASNYLFCFNEQSSYQVVSGVGFNIYMLIWYLHFKKTVIISISNEEKRFDILYSFIWTNFSSYSIKLKWYVKRYFSRNVPADLKLRRVCDFKDSTQLIFHRVYDLNWKFSPNQFRPKSVFWSVLYL